MAYTLETILAEKYETIIRRNIGTTRARDFYDLHTLFQMRRDAVRVPILKEAVIHTARKRGSLDDLQDWKEIVQDIRSEAALQQLWINYIQDNRFASGLTFSEVVDTVETIGSLLGIGVAE
jgi:predicted nucleotidyltransferase component of viral defense system